MGDELPEGLTPPPRPLGPGAPARAPALIVAGLAGAAALVLAVAGLQGAAMLRAADGDGEPVTVVDSYLAQHRDPPEGWADVRFADGQVRAARIPNALVGALPVGRLTHAHRYFHVLGDGVAIDEGLDIARHDGAAYLLLGGVLVPLLAAAGALGAWRMSRQRRLLEAGIAVRGSVTEVAPGAKTSYRIRYRYPLPNGFDGQGQLRLDLDRLSQMGPIPEAGQVAWVVYDPRRPERSTVWSFAAR